MPTFTHTWLEPDDVATWLRLNTATATTDAVELERVCAMTEAYVQRCRPEFLPPAPEDGSAATYVPDAETYQGAVMYAAREVRRRNTPAGVESFGDVGVVFTPKWDADIERALRTGAWTLPGMG